MLEVKKDRLKEIDKQVKKAIRCGNWSYKKELDKEKKDLENQIQMMMEVRSGRK